MTATASRSHRSSIESHRPADAALVGPVEQRPRTFHRRIRPLHAWQIDMTIVAVSNGGIEIRASVKASSTSLCRSKTGTVSRITSLIRLLPLHSTAHADRFLIVQGLRGHVFFLNSPPSCRVNEKNSTPRSNGMAPIRLYNTHARNSYCAIFKTPRKESDELRH